MCRIIYNCTIAVQIRQALSGLGHLQNRAEEITHNYTVNSYVHLEMRVKRSKSWDMRYNWLRNRTTQQQFAILWDKRIHNLANYLTKHHPLSHHQIKRHDYVLNGF